MTDRKVRTAVFPVAGRGTRFLPATKSVPKELLPVVDTPLLQFALEEARAAGVERMVFVSHPSKSSIEHFVRDSSGPASEETGAHEDDDCRFVMQEKPLGLGHAVLQARDLVLPGPVAVILPDDLILGPVGCLSEMADAYESGTCGHMVAAMEVPSRNVSSYGVLAPLSVDGRVTRAHGMVEKPAPEDAPSNLAVVGRYILDSSIFADLEKTAPGAGGEIQLTDAIAAGIERVGLSGFAFSGTRYDCGSKEGMLDATIAYASLRPELREVIERPRPLSRPTSIAAE